MTAKEIQNVNIFNEDLEVVQDFVYLGSVVNSNRDRSQETKKKVENVKGSHGRIGLGKIIKSKDVSLATKAKITHTLIFSFFVYRCKR